VWLQRANAAVKPAIAAPAAFATSPLVLAASAAAADKIQAGTDWKDLLTSSNGVRLSDPAATTAGLLAIATALPSLGADAHALLTQLAQDVAPSTTDVVAASGKDAKAGAALAAEADIIVHNRADSEHRLSAVVPGNQTLSFQYSLVGLATNPDTKKAVDGLRSFLASKDAAAILAANGLRPMADQKAVPTQTGAVTADFTAAVPSDQVLKTASDSWQAATIDFRLLAVIDVSGSMRERVAGSTRIGLTAQAAQKALGALPKSTELGLWAFSVGRGPGGLDYKELAPIGPLDDEQQLGRLSQAVTTLPRQVGGGTALYDTIWGAYQRVLDGYDADRVNAVVILTDGRNDDPNGISLSQLKARLATADPKRPVAITTIGIGPAVDGEALSQISEMMHSSYYPATQPEDISQVLAQALTDHTCTDGVCA
jgi:Mg-chelatase subunit ChlD